MRAGVEVGEISLTPTPTPTPAKITDSGRLRFRLRLRLRSPVLTISHNMSIVQLVVICLFCDICFVAMFM